MNQVYTGIIRRNGEVHIVKSDSPETRDLLVTNALGGDVAAGIEGRQAEFMRNHCPCDNYEPGKDGKCLLHGTDILGNCFKYKKGNVEFG